MIAKQCVCGQLEGVHSDDRVDHMFVWNGLTVDTESDAVMVRFIG